MSGLNRKQTIRRDCLKCTGNGYIIDMNREVPCPACGGKGMIEMQIDYQFHTHGKLTREEIAQRFGVRPDQVRDAGHDIPSTGAPVPDAE